MGISRRKLLALLAASPLLSNLKGWSQPKPSAIQSKSFFIWLHGIFGITVEEDKTILVSPNLQDDKSNTHLYAVGRIIKPNLNSKPSTISTFEGIKEFKTIKDANKYVIQGLQPGPKATETDQREFAVFSNAELDPSANALFLDVPAPTRILPLRFQITHAGSVPGSSTPPPFDVPDGLIPLLHVLEFENFNGSTVSVLPAQAAAGTAPLYQTEKGQHHLHIFAEPDPTCNDMTCHNGPEALKALISCYKGIPIFQFEPRVPDPAPLENILGFANIREQFSFLEWTNQSRYGFRSAGARATSRPLDCPHFLVLSKKLPAPQSLFFLDKAHTNDKKKRMLFLDNFKQPK